MAILSTNLNSRPKVVILTPFKLRHRYFVKELMSNGVEIELVVIKTKYKNLFTLLKKNSSISGFLDNLVTLMEFFSKGWVSVPKVAIKKVDKYNDDSIVKLINSTLIDAIIVYGGPIIPTKFLNSLDSPILNVHGAILPGYRGLDSHWWLFFEHKMELQGYTIHFVDDRIDSGGILKTQKFDSAAISLNRLVLWRLWIAKNSSLEISRLLRKPLMKHKPIFHDLNLSTYRSSISIFNWMIYMRKKTESA